MVRDLAAKMGKQVQVVMEGEGTELDKGLIEKITDPLTHLVRNSVDHGIEMPEQRVASGKPELGTVILRAFHQGGNIVIEIVDDGAGLNRERILTKARERGMNVPDSISDGEVWQLIFEAGFSTAEVVTDVSGRGVGMDVVKRNIQALGGRVEIDSKLGAGTRITIRLPLTLAILDGLSVSVAEQLFIIPLSYIVESLQPRAADVKAISNHGQVIQVRGEYLPVIRLYELFNLPTEVTEIERGIMLILESDGVKKALFVDELIGQHQVVIKSLETNYRKVEGVSGATIMGNGKVALIIDAGAIVRSTTPNLLAAA
jgi:two-component system chemotaxis sensor kinase CheA